MITDIKHVSIPVQNQERALKFYTEVLGFKLICNVDFGTHQNWIELALPEGHTKVVLFTPEGHEHLVGMFSNVLFTCKDVQKTYEELLAKGVEFTQPPTAESWGTFVIFKDSEGNSFCLSNAD